MEQMKLDIKDMPNNSVKKPMQELSEKLITDFFDNLISITITGSSLTDDYIKGKSDINTVLVFKEETMNVLNGISDLGRLLFKNHFDMPLIMIPSHIERSCDVFGVEYLDFQLNHKTIYGESPFKSLVIEKNDVRLQCEREFKANMIRLRQGYVASKVGPVKLVDILSSCASGLLPYLRAMLWLSDKEREPLIASTLESASNEFGFQVEPLAKLIGWKHEKPKPDKMELQDSFEYLYELIGSLSLLADKIEF
ncbi:MAG: hypothetical protein ACIAQZ_03575 [Sedimentisphaeraceae bacterium JB056]